MPFGVIFISGIIALLVALLEGWQWHKAGGEWLKFRLELRRSLFSGLILVGGVTLFLLGLSETPLLWGFVLGGGILGLSLVLVSPIGRISQAVAVLIASLWVYCAETHELSLGQLVALGLGAGCVVVPCFGTLPWPSAGQGLLRGILQVWLWMAASTWGIRLAEITSLKPEGWSEILPLGLSTLTLVGGTIPDLLSRESKRLTRGVGVGVTAILGVTLVRNWLQQDNFYALLFALGGVGSLILAELEANLDHPRRNSSSLVWQSIFTLSLVGGLALLALRLGGSYGSALIGLGLLTCFGSWGSLAALFLAGRPMIQSLLYEFDLNLSGINITHAYTYAALYLGMASVVVGMSLSWVYAPTAPVLIQVGLSASSIVLTGLVAYFLHLEPLASFLLSGMMAALILAALSPLFLPKAKPWFGLQGLLWGMLGICTSLTMPELIPLGEESSRLERVGVLSGILLIAGILLVIFSKTLTKKTMDPGDSEYPFIDL